MRFRVIFSPSAEDDLAYYRVFEQRIIVDAIKAHLVLDANVESKRRKKMIENRLASWELRTGDFRLFYEIEGDALVKIISIGHKHHNQLLIRGKRVEL
jgi:mRNA-degrading endonuclease RelE of RelBE toxin-antitoxin system